MDGIYETLKAIDAYTHRTRDTHIEMDGLNFMQLVQHGFVVQNDNANQFDLTPRGHILRKKMDGVAQILNL